MTVGRLSVHPMRTIDNTYLTNLPIWTLRRHSVLSAQTIGHAVPPARLWRRTFQYIPAPSVLSVLFVPFVCFSAMPFCARTGTFFFFALQTFPSSSYNPRVFDFFLPSYPLAALVCCCCLCVYHAPIFKI